jgi:hypothetical protein
LKAQNLDLIRLSLEIRKNDIGGMTAILAAMAPRDNPDCQFKGCPTFSFGMRCRIPNFMSILELKRWCAPSGACGEIVDAQIFSCAIGLS